MSVCRKVKPDGSVFDPAETKPQGSREDFARKELSKRPTVMLQGVYMAHECLPESQT